MYALDSEISKIRTEEKANAKSRDDEMDPGMVSTGIQGDAIQPLVLRANQGDCVRVHFSNKVEDEDAGFQVLGSAMIISSSGLPASAASAPAPASCSKSRILYVFYRSKRTLTPP